MFSIGRGRSLHSSRANIRRIEKFWQDKWKQDSKESVALNDKEKNAYILSMFPYPSGSLHMGHVRVYTISDCISRFKRMTGKKVLHPIGWDSFGLPAENAAIERGINPKDWTNQFGKFINIAQMKQQLLNLGIKFDWSQELSTCDPRYYKWTQWLFLQLLKHGLLYRKKALVNWDPVDCTVLANEQVDNNGFAWRSGAKVEKRFLNQWFVKTSSYAERLLVGLEDLDWPASVKRIQKNWIGKSEGYYFDFKLKNCHKGSIRVFTTCPDTIYGVCFIALSTEHPLLNELDLSQDMKNEIEALMLNETGYNGEKRGVDLQLEVVHPITKDPIPVYVANYVLNDYGLQAIMGVPSRDERDKQFADSVGVKDAVDVLSGMNGDVEDVEKIMEIAESEGFGGRITLYKLRDWLISRQRYWGTPIPIVHCEKCGTIPVPEHDLPVILPESPNLKRGSLQNLEWTKTTCGKKDCVAMRETDTMDTFVDSSWYYMRYPDAHNDQEIVSASLERQWLPVDVYIGGIEHANLHLLYARFISYFLHDIGVLHEPEPFRQLISQGMVHGKTYYVKKTGECIRDVDVGKYQPDELKVKWEKMSKSKHNGVDPNSCVEEYGADVMRIYMLFKAPPEQEIQWDMNAIKGMYLWLNRVWKIVHGHIDSSSAYTYTPKTDEIRNLVSARNRAIEQVTRALDKTNKFNVAIAELMTLSNALKGWHNLMGGPEYHTALIELCQLMSPFAPHVSSQIYEELRTASKNLDLHQDMRDVHKQRWPIKNELDMNEIDIAVLVNGRRIKTLKISKDVPVDMRSKLALKAVEEHGITKVIVTSNGEVVNILTT